MYKVPYKTKQMYGLLHHKLNTTKKLTRTDIHHTYNSNSVESKLLTWFGTLRSWANFVWRCLQFVLNSLTCSIYYSNITSQNYTLSAPWLSQMMQIFLTTTLTRHVASYKNATSHYLKAFSDRRLVFQVIFVNINYHGLIDWAKFNVPPNTL